LEKAYEKKVKIRPSSGCFDAPVRAFVYAWGDQK